MKYHLGFYFLICTFLNFIGSVQSQNKFSNPTRNTVSPERYSLKIVPFLNNLTFWGEVVIEFSVVNYTKEITLHSENLILKRFAMKASDPGAFPEPVFSVKQRLGDWLVSTRQALSGRYSINISFTGQLDDVRTEEGFYYNLYINNETDTLYVATYSRVGEARRLFPCFDEPALQAPFTIHIARFANQSSNSNMALAHTSPPLPSLEGRVWDSYYESPTMSTHQVGYSVHELRRLNNRSFSVLAASDALDQVVLAVSMLPKATHTLQQWLLNRTLPVSKLDILALPDSVPDKTHTPGLVTCREDQVLFKEGISNARSRHEVVHSLLNILAHQWFCRQVALQSWLVDGIATYLEYKMVSKMEPSWRTSEMFSAEVLQEAFLQDFQSFSKGKRVMFYKKAAAILRMLESMTSEIVIKKGLLHFSRFSGLVTPQQLLEGFKDEAVQSADLTNFSLPALLKAWTSHPGHPLVTVMVTDSSMTISQSDYLQKQFEWPLLLTYRAQQESQYHKAWLTPGNDDLILPLNNSSDGWVLFNINQTGYYRVNYNTRNWELLTKQLMSNHSVLSAVTRSQLIDDAFQLALSGVMNYSVPFRLSLYLTKERDYVPWSTATRNFQKLIKLFYGTPLALQLQRYVRELYTPYFDSAHGHLLSSDAHVTRLARMDVLHWACQWQMVACLNFSTALFKQWQSVSTGFPPDYKLAALCVGVRQFPELFLDVFDSFTQSLVEADRQVFITALACTNHSQHLYYLMKTAFLDKNEMMIGHHSKLQLFDQIVSSPRNVRLVINFLVHNYDAVVTELGKKLLNSFWTSLGENIHLQSDIKLVQEIVKNATVAAGLREGLNSSLTAALRTQRQSGQLAPLVSAAMHLVAPHNSSASLSQFEHPHLVLMLVFFIVTFFKY